MVIIIWNNSYSQELIELSGYVIFNKTNEKVGNTEINFLSHDLSYDTTIIADNNGYYKVIIPKNQYHILANNDSLTGSSTINIAKTSYKDILMQYNPIHNYKIFKTGFSKIYTNKNTITIGLKDNGEFCRTTFICCYAIYSLTENGTFKITGKKLTTKTISTDSHYHIDEVTNKIKTYTIKKDSCEYIVDYKGTRYYLTDFDKLKQW